MIKNLIHRSLSLTLAAVLTLGMLGSIDGLSQPGSDTVLMAGQAAQQTAQQTAQRTAQQTANQAASAPSV